MNEQRTPEQIAADKAETERKSRAAEAEKNQREAWLKKPASAWKDKALTEHQAFAKGAAEKTLPENPPHGGTFARLPDGRLQEFEGTNDKGEHTKPVGEPIGKATTAAKASSTAPAPLNAAPATPAGP